MAPPRGVNSPTARRCGLPRPGAIGILYAVAGNTGEGDSRCTAPASASARVRIGAPRRSKSRKLSCQE